MRTYMVSVLNTLTADVARTEGRMDNDETFAEKRVHALQEEVLALQSRYQRELQRLEQENRELRQQNLLLRQGRQPVARKMKVFCSENYTV